MKKYILIPVTLFLTLIVRGQNNLFSSDSLLELRISGDIRGLMNDRSDEPREFPLVLSYQEGDNPVQVPVSSRTRGNFRRKLGGCIYPPVMLLFQEPGNNNGIFHEQRKLKWVVPCKGDQFVVREYLAYRIYNLITPLSFRARLVKATLEDTRRGKNSGPFYSMLLEEEDQMARRNGMVDVEKRIGPLQTIRQNFLTMAVFEYLIGNTDWSVEYMQNIKMIAPDSNSVPFTVPYDFDHAGLVNAPYAEPAPELELSSVRERRFRGFCLTDLSELDSSLAIFNRLREDIYEIYRSTPYLDDRSRNESLKYLDEFYGVINDKERMKKAFSYPCDPRGTGNVIIRGIRN